MATALALSLTLSACERASPTSPSGGTDKTTSPPSSTPTISAPAVPQPPAAPPPPDIAWTAELTSADGTYLVKYLCEPDPIILGELFRLTVGVFDAKNGAPAAEGVDLRVDAVMPEHEHGMNTKPAIERGADGLYHVDGMLLHMAGYWEIYFDAVDHGVVERAQTSLTLE